MAGSGSQRNKAHKAGRRAGLSAREKHRNSKDAGARRGVKASRPGAQNKAERLNAAKQQRDQKRAATLGARRAVGPPKVVMLLPLSSDVDVPRLWAGLLDACSAGGDAPPGGSARESAAAAAGGMEVDAGAPPSATPAHPLAMTTVSLAERRKARFTFLPPPVDRNDPLAVVELARAAECVLLALPGDVDTTTIDDAGALALGVLRALGLPSVVALVQAPAASAAAGPNAMRERAAAKKHATLALQEQLPGEHRLFAADTPQDLRQAVRHLAEATLSPPQWRTHRPSVLVEGAEFVDSAPQQAQPAAGGSATSAAVGTLLLRGYVRGLGLSANQALHIPGAGDFQLQQIEGPPEPVPANEPAGVAAIHRGKGQQAGQRHSGDAAPMDASATVPAAHQGGSGGQGDLPVLAVPDSQQQESLVRENDADPLAGEQTWPTEEELMEAEAGRSRKRRLPRGTSDYQAAWILDDSDLDDTDLDSEGGEEEGEGGSGRANGSAKAGSGRPDDEDEDESLPDLEPNEGWLPGGTSVRDVDTGTEFGMDYEEESLPGGQASLKERIRAEQDDQMFPDEVDTPEGIPARRRFDKYRGLKSMRTSPWDPKESLPRDYARVFAFENFRRAHKRAVAAALAAGAAGDPHGVPAGAYVQLRVANVPADVAARVLERTAAAQRGEALPPVAFGLLQHECKLSVQHYGLRKAAGYTEPLASKEALLLVNGLRTFSARPVYSTDEHGADKHKMERYLHDGRPSVATVYAPIAYPPLPLLAFKPGADGAPPRLAATGSLRSCDPDRIVLKKIVLSGYPVKVHKGRAVVRFMFHNPDDVRWFKPVELWTRGGRRGRIREPVGTHGSMKCVFDGPLKQQDAVLMSLYKRVYPKWPESLEFAA